MQALVRKTRILDALGRIGQLERLAPDAEPPFFFDQIGKVFPAHGETKHRVAFLAGCIANISFARLNEATVRVLQHNELRSHRAPPGKAAAGRCMFTPGCGKWAGDKPCKTSRRSKGGGYDAYITNAAGCGSVLKEYHELFEHDPSLHERAKAFSDKVTDVSEYLSAIEFNRDLGPLPITVTYQDSCHLLHGQKVRTQPREIAGGHPRASLQGTALQRNLLRQRRHLQRRAHRHVDEPA